MAAPLTECDAVVPAAGDQPTGLQVVEYSTILDKDSRDLDSWGKVLQRVIKAVVTIKVNVLRTFDTHPAGIHEGTGFVVDRSQGIILSNRHVVTQAPITATAIFGNYEEIALRQDYVDPVHDFAFFRYDPGKVKFAEVEELELFPQGAKVGLDIKICGNDSGEKLSILGATLARLDRAAPNYGLGYNDFNINYFQAASGTSGGSSGSPVLDIQGRAVALNAGGNSDGSSSSFYLPLEPVVRALKFVQRREKIPRGTLQTIFEHSSYDELKRLGIPEAVEKECRERNKLGIGLLTVSKILPDGPGYKSGIAAGDIVVECYQESFGKRFIDGFHSLWEIIDGSVGKDITLTIYRGDELKHIRIKVQDLHSITPNTFVEVSEGIFHPFSYQLARSYHMPCKGIFAARTGIFHFENPSGKFIITQIAEQEINTMEDFKRVWFSCPDSARVGFRFMALGGRNEQFGLVEVDHHFYGAAQFTRTNGGWTREILSPTLVEEPRRLKRAATIEIHETRNDILRNSLLMIQCRIPYSVDGIVAPSKHQGVGILVAGGKTPLIIASRTTVLHSICEISITIGKRNVPGRVLHMGLLAVITIDPKHLPDTLPLLKPCNRDYKVGDAVDLFGLNTEYQLVQKRTEISAITELRMPETTTPSWRITNTESYDLLDSPFTIGGALIDPDDSSLVGFWMEIKYGDRYGMAGINYQYYIQPIIEALTAGDSIESWSSGCVFEQLHLAKAIDLGIPEHHASRIAQVAKSIGTGAHAIWVEETLLHSTSGLELGDIILEIEKEPVGRMADIRQFSRAQYTNTIVLRDRKEKELVVHSQKVPVQEAPRIVSWAGALLQKTPQFAIEQTTPEFARVAAKEGIETLQSLVYICERLKGSPADEHPGLPPVHWILEINKQKVSSLDGLVEIIRKVRVRDEDSEYVQVKLLGTQGTTSILGVRLNSHFWSAWMLEGDGNSWIRRELE